MFSNNVALVLQKLVIEKMSLESEFQERCQKRDHKKEKKKKKIKKSPSPKFTYSVFKVKRQLLMAIRRTKHRSTLKALGIELCSSHLGELFASKEPTSKFCQNQAQYNEFQVFQAHFKRGPLVIALLLESF